MEKRTKVWLVLAILSSVYLIYIVGVASLLSPYFQIHFILNVFNQVSTNNSDSTGSVMNWTALVTFVLWIIWGVLFVRED
jgi:hypothetical protein